MKTPLITIFLWLISLIQLQAGWIIKEKSGDEKNGSKIKRVYFFQDQQLKLVENDLVSIFNLNTDMITFILPKQEMYWQGNIETYNHEFMEVLKESFEMKADSLPDVEREMTRASLSYYLAVMNDSSRTNEPLLDMALINTGRKEKIAGYEATIYGLYVNKILKEEFWVAERVQVNTTFDMIHFNNLLKGIGNGLAGDLNEEANKVFEKLLKKGYLMKRVEYDFKSQSVTEVTGVKKKLLSEKIFLVPEKYIRVGLKELGLK